ncbi:MAG: hypothetical protein M1282_17555, partial [Chloroflexi bacterium]|nr:hypothetical protein [Chloroflexota bacterium]
DERVEEKQNAEKQKDENKKERWLCHIESSLFSNRDPERTQGLVRKGRQEKHFKSLCSSRSSRLILCLPNDFIDLVKMI